MHQHCFPGTLAKLAVLLLLISSLSACTRPDSEMVIPAAKREQLFQLQGRIQQGPSAGLNLSGDLRVAIDHANHLRGTLLRESGSPITVTGQIDGQAIHLSFDLGDNHAVSGVGTLQHSIDNPQGTAGGLLTGPQPGDSGDWFGSWTIIVTPATPTPATSTLRSSDTPWSSILVLALMIAIALLLLGVLLRQTARGKVHSSRTNGRSGISFVKASAQTVEPERWPAEATLPLAQFATAYTYGDDHYDLSFTIKSARGDFLGECGAGISATVDHRSAQAVIKSESSAWLESLATSSENDKHKAVTALEVWIFDKNDINTVTKVLRSTHGFYNPAQRASRDHVHEVLVIEPDQIVVLETKSLRLRVKVIAVEYLTDVTGSSGLFKQVSLKLAVWAK